MRLDDRLRGHHQGSEDRWEVMRALSSRPFCSCDGRRVSLGDLSAAYRDTTPPMGGHRGVPARGVMPERCHCSGSAVDARCDAPAQVRRAARGGWRGCGHSARPLWVTTCAVNKYPPAEPEVLRLLAPRRGLTAIEKSKPKTEKTTNCIIPELSNFGSPPAEPGVYHD